MAFRFVFMADCQLGCYASFSGLTADDVRRYAASDMQVRAVPPVEGWEWDARQLRTAVAAARRLDPAFVVIGGDMVDDPTSDGQYAELRSVTAELGDIPLHWVPGNHDAAFDVTVPTPESLAAYRRRFGPDHYAFRHESTVGIVVNTVVLDHPEQLPDELERQLDWLHATLRQARDQDAAHILVFGHHPLFIEHPDEADSYWNIPRARRDAVLRLLTEFGARAFFCGHWHRNGGGWAGDVEVAVTGPVGYPLGDDPSGFRVVDVTDDRVEHRYVALDTVTAPGRG